MIEPNLARESFSTNPFAAASSPFNRALNPFSAEAGGAESFAEDAPTEAFTYALVKSGPAIDPDEVELLNVQAVEVMILWGANVLHVSHLSPPRDFYVGEEQKEKVGCDFFVPAEKLGTTRLPLVLGDADAVDLVLPADARGSLKLPGQTQLSLDEARRRARPLAEHPGAHRIALPGGAKARVELGDFVFQIAAVNAGKPVKRGLGSGPDWRVLPYFAATLLAHAGLMAAMAFFVPPLGLTEDEGIGKEQLHLIQQYLSAAAEREQAEQPPDPTPESHPQDREGGTGTQARSESGSMGTPTSQAQTRRYAVAGPQDNPDPHLARQAALREATEFGMIGLLNTGLGGDPNAPTAPWGRETSLGRDEVSARGNMWGDEIGDAFGSSGLGLTGIGEGAGGRGEGIGLGDIGTLAYGGGTGTKDGFGSGPGRLNRGHVPRAPRVIVGSTTVSGRLPPEVIQRIVRQNYGRFRLCYEQGLASNPNLQGRVTARFVIGRDGSVSNAANGGSDLADSKVVQCVVRAYYGLTFPQPENGIVTVVYPIMFSPG